MSSSSKRTELRSPRRPRRRARALLGYLALHPGPHPRAALASRFWPDVLDESARTSLRGALADIRRAIGATRLVATREAAGLAGDPWTDAAAFAALVAEGRDADALELCRGELLAGLDDDWIVAARDEHRDAQSAALARLAAAAGPDEALRHARARVALDPLSEDAHRDLMRRQADAGDRAAALATYGRLAERLRTELRIAPSATTRELADVAARGRRRPPAAPARARPGAGTQPLRRPRRRSSTACAPASRAPSGGSLAISGDPGIGKTRLLAELARAAHADGATVLYGRSPEEAVAPYQPFAEALRPLASADAGLAPLFGDTAAGRRAGRPPAAVRGGRRGSGRGTRPPGAARARRPPLGRPADAAPARPRAARTRATPRSSSPAPTGRASSGRGHPLARALADLRRDRLVERIPLGGLDDAAATGLIAGWVGTGTSAGLAGAVQEETGGNPFFIEEVLRHLLESGALDADGRLVRPARELGVPESVREVIGRRLDRLGERRGRGAGDRRGDRPRVRARAARARVRRPARGGSSTPWRPQPTPT